MHYARNTEVSCCILSHLAGLAQACFFYLFKPTDFSTAENIALTKPLRVVCFCWLWPFNIVAAMFSNQKSAHGNREWENKGEIKAQVSQRKQITLCCEKTKPKPRRGSQTINNPSSWNSQAARWILQCHMDQWKLKWKSINICKVDW